MCFIETETDQKIKPDYLWRDYFLDWLIGRYLGLYSETCIRLRLSTFWELVTPMSRLSREAETPPISQFSFFNLLLILLLSVPINLQYLPNQSFIEKRTITVTNKHYLETTFKCLFQSLIIIFFCKWINVPVCRIIDWFRQLKLKLFRNKCLL